MKLTKSTKQTVKAITYVMLAFIMAFNISCSPEDGEDGAQGPQGEQGPTGQDGADGEDGNANVITSAWLDANWNVSDTDTQKTMQITPEEIGISNSDLRNNCLVIVYLSQWGDSNIYTMPSSGRWSTAWYSYTYGNTGANVSGIRIKLESTNGTTLTEYQYAGFRGNRFRYVIIPTNNTNRNSLDFTNMSYEELINHFGLED
ncbi:collagen-like protein [Mangrovimonas spongiae]|uniref:Collagen-like protein n=1 Tax=Mangrovimonas spongiae TaxID=2494697 RepID=A0A428K6X5_9FLAO|nr:collagen-like protein [Mangrovimonas spongiae]RSK42122.1 collagen-like protein [Mangrovimonas spongiae]